MGIPTMVVTREGFPGLVVTSYKGMGFPAEAPTIHEFPLDMFLPGAALTPLREGIEHVVYALTKWEPTAKEKGTFVPPMFQLLFRAVIRIPFTMRPKTISFTFN